MEGPGENHRSAENWSAQVLDITVLASAILFSRRPAQGVRMTKRRRPGPA